MKSFLQILFFFLLVTQLCFAQWYQQNSGTTATLYTVHFLDANNGWVVGDSGIILHTTNGGQEWILQSSGKTLLLRHVCFIDVDNGWVVGHAGTILRTTNGGDTWTEKSSGTTIMLNGVSFINLNNGTTVSDNGIILRTTNGGESWINQSSGTTNSLGRVYFSDANIGTAVGNGGTILRTTDGGQNWLSQTSGTTNWLQDVSFTDINIGTAVGEGGTILRTTNGGHNWFPQVSGIHTWIYGVFFTDANNGTAVASFAIPDYGFIIRTTNGGENWILQSEGTHDLFGVSFIDENNGWVVGGKGTILHTTNGGNPVPVELNSFSATANGKEVTLNWSTATELNNQGFEVQRKFGANDFMTVGSVKGNGTTTSPNNYTYIDKLTDAGKYFYRLKQIDFGGKYEYSQVVEVNWSPFTTYKLEQNFSNPFNPTTTIGFGIPEKGNVRLSVLNILGEEIRILLNEEKEAGYHSIDFNGK